MSGVKARDRSRLDGCEIELFQLVKKAASPEQWKEWLRVPLEHAAADGNVDLFTRLMDAGADSSAGWRGCGGRTLLGAAARGKDVTVVSALLEAGAKPDVDVLFQEHAPHQLPRKSAPLHVAAYQGTELASKALLLAGANPNLRDDYEQTPLHRAASSEEWGSVRVLRALLNHGCKVNVRDDEGLTALHLAAGVECNSGDKVRVLLEAGAKVNARSGACDEYWWDVGINGCSDFAVTPVHTAIQRSVPTSALKTLLEAGADVHAQTGERMTALHIASYLCNTGAVEILLNAGVDINARTAHGQTALHHACEVSDERGVDVLLRLGANEKLLDYQRKPATGVIGGTRRERSHFGQGEESPTEVQTRIRRMLERAPADRVWRRRGWLVLYRAYPTRFQLVGSSNCSPRCAKDLRTGSVASGGELRDNLDSDLSQLVGNVVGLEADDVFRLIVSLL